MAMEAPDAGGARLWSDVASPASGLYRLLREIHLLGRRLRVGRPVRVNRRRTGDARCCTAAPTLSRDFGENNLARGVFADRGQRGDSVSLARLLVAAGNLPDGDARTSNVCDRSAVQEHRRLRVGQD